MYTMGMARDDERRKGFWDDAEEETSAVSAKGKPAAATAVTSDQVELKINEAKVLMDQIHQLYQHYFNGVEKRPPEDKARLLDARIKEIERMSGSTTAGRFKLGQFIAQYRQFRDLWDRKLRQMEKT
jgi:hypothetical protein